MAINPHTAIGAHIRAEVLREEERRRLQRLALVEQRLDEQIVRAGREASIEGRRTIRVGKYTDIGYTSDYDLRKNLDLLPEIIKTYEAAGWVVEHKTEEFQKSKWKFTDHYLELTAPLQVVLKPATTIPHVKTARVPQNPRSGYVYLLEAENGLYKIGRSKTPKFRISEITKAVAPFVIKEVHKAWYPDCYAVEAELHKRFADKRKRGEWFELSAEEAQEVINHAFSPA